MPDWLGPALNTTALATIVAFVLWGIVRIARFAAPLITDLFKVVREFFQTHIELGSTLKDTSIQQASLLERSVGMQNDNGEVLRDVHGLLHVHSEQMRNIADAVGATRVAGLNPHPSTVTFMPGVERSATGTDHPVVVKTEVIRPPEQAP